MSLDKQLKYSATTLGVLIAGIVCCITTGAPIYLGIVAAYACTVMQAAFLNYALVDIIKISFTKMGKVKNIIVLLLLIGGLMALWLEIGLIQGFVYLGLEHLRGINIIACGFVVSVFIALIMGSAVGTLSAVGMIFMGLAQGAGINAAIMAGALVSGAYVGDVVAPLSPMVNLVAATTKTSVIENIRFRKRELLIGLLSALFVFLILGGHQTGAEGLVDVEPIKNAMKERFDGNYLALFPIVALFLAVGLFKRSVIQGVFVSTGVTLLVGTMSMDLSFFEMARTWIFGYYPEQQSALAIASGRGLVSMVTIVATVFASTLLNGTLEGLGQVDRLLGWYNGTEDKNGVMMLKTAITNMILTIVTCNQSLAIIVTADYYQRKYEAKRIDNRELAHIITDNGVIMAPLISWNINGIIAERITGVPTLQYFPFAVLCIALPCLSWIKIAKRIANQKNEAKQESVCQ